MRKLLFVIFFVGVLFLTGCGEIRHSRRHVSPSRPSRHTYHGRYHRSYTRPNPRYHVSSTRHGRYVKPSHDRSRSGHSRR
jgi:hypothetical protein